MTTGHINPLGESVINLFSMEAKVRRWKPSWPSEVEAGDLCYYWDEWVPVVVWEGVKRVGRDGPTVEEVVGCGAKFKRVEYV